MTKITPSKLLILITFITAVLLLAACSPSAENLNNQGNEAFAEQEYLVALHEYQSAQVESPELAEPYYNAANALYREGAYVEALEQMQLALQYVEDETLVENSIYNMGNTFYNTQELDPAVESYISALLLDPDDQDAKYNLELALQQQQQEQEQQQEQDNQDQEQSENGEDQGEEQNQEDQSQNGENQDQEGDQENESESGSENEDQQNEEDQDQGDPGSQPQDSEERSDQQEQPGQLPPGQRMTEEQARQLLAALAQDMETLQERLGQILRVQIPPPAQDW